MAKAKKLPASTITRKRRRRRAKPKTSKMKSGSVTVTLEELGTIVGNAVGAVLKQ